MKPSDIRIGTTYRIRGWEDMVAEFGKKNGKVSHPTQRVAYFVPAMKELCGMAYTPEKIGNDGVCRPTVEGECDTWTICAYMLEPLTDAPPAPRPALRIGSFTITRHDAKSLWIATEDDPGGQFSDEVVEKALREMYRKHNQGGVK